MHRRGVMGLELIVVIAVLLTIVTITVPLFLHDDPTQRENITRERIGNIKKAILGTPQRIIERSRTSFNFLGDLGVLPDNLTELLERAPTRPLYSISNNVWFGWRGPYLNSNLNQFGNYTSTLDAWGNFITYTDANGNPVDGDDLNGIVWPVIIRNPGANDIYDANDPLFHIYENEVRTYLSGTFRDRSGNPIVQNQVTVYFPNGTGVLDSVQITTGISNPARTSYDSQTDTVSDPNKRKIPLGNRYFLTQAQGLEKLAALNGGEMSMVNFVADGPVTPPGKFFERTFYPTDDDGANPITPVMGTWDDDDLGNYYADGGYGEYRAVFGDPTWDDYRIEVDATLYQGRGYGIYYRSDGQTNITGYCFQYDPGASSPFFMTFTVRKVINSVEQSPFQLLDIPFFLFPNIYNASHHISITVQGDHHILKVDGNEIFNFYDNQFMVGMAGLRSWDGNHYVDFHHLLVYDIPPLPTDETVWWSFEEGGGDTVYGSGFLIGAAEINGTLADPAHVSRTWQANHLYGQAMYMDGHNNGYIDFGDVLDYSATDAFTISLWVKMPAINPAQEYTAISKIWVSGNPGNPNVGGWILRLMQETGHNFGAVFSLGQRIDKANPSQSRELKLLNDLNGAGLQPNQWYHIAITYDGTVYGGNDPISANSMVVYVTPQSANVVTAPTLSVVTETLRANHSTTHGNDMRIGSAVNFSSPFQGYIDEVRIYNRALSMSEVNDVFQKHK